MQAVAATGRLSSTQPNLQNIPIRTARGREIRKAFVPRDADHVLLAADYSQVELRIVAALSGDRGSVCGLPRWGRHPHGHGGQGVRCGPEEVDRGQRSQAKAVNFGILYGQGAFGLAETLKIPRREAKGIIEAYFAEFADLKAYKTRVVDEAKENGYVETVLGRKRWLPDITSANAVVRGFAERNAINAPIQGSAADIIKMAMVRIQQALREGGYGARMILQVHDELVFDVPKSEAEAVLPWCASTWRARSSWPSRSRWRCRPGRIGSKPTDHGAMAGISADSHVDMEGGRQASTLRRG